MKTITASSKTSDTPSSPSVAHIDENEGLIVAAALRYPLNLSILYTTAVHNMIHSIPEFITFYRQQKLIPTTPADIHTVHKLFVIYQNHFSFTEIPLILYYAQLFIQAYYRNAIALAHVKSTKNIIPNLTLILFISMYIGQKILNDEEYSFVEFAGPVIHNFPLRQIKKSERRFLQVIDYRLFMPLPTYQHWLLWLENLKLSIAR